MSRELQKIRLRSLRSACRRIAAAREWAVQAGLFNVGAELHEAQKEIEGYLIDEPTNAETREEG